MPCALTAARVPRSALQTLGHLLHPGILSPPKRFKMAVCSRVLSGRTLQRAITKSRSTRGVMVVAARARAYHSSTLLQSAPAGARMSPQEVQDTLRMNQYTSGEQFIPPDESGNSSCPVKSFDMNVLRSNNPIEDSHAEAIIRVGSKVRPWSNL